MPEENKHGYVVFDGRPSDFHHWLFRTQLKFAAARRQHQGEETPPKLGMVMQNVVENLRGEALQVAMTIGIDVLIRDNGSGAEVLIEALRKYIFPIAAHEAKELYKEGHNMKDSVLTRQSGESMQNYILRRKRWYDLLTQLDDSVNLGTTKLGD